MGRESMNNVPEFTKGMEKHTEIQVNCLHFFLKERIKKIFFKVSYMRRKRIE